MKRFGILLASFLLIMGKLWAIPENYDIYGVDEKTKQLISAACSDLMSEHLAYMSKLFTSPTNPSESELRYKEIIELKILDKAKQFGHFSHAKLSSVHYPTDKKIYVTLDLVNETDKYRIPKQIKTRAHADYPHKKEVNELFAIWYAYQDRQYDLIRKNQMDFGKLTCPVTHCIWGFNDKELKETLPKIKQAVAKHKADLIEIIKHSTHDQKRADAVFILAHDDNYIELASFLINYTDDSSEMVRNNVMRVLGAIAFKHELKQLDIQRILDALNYPYVSDRNKAAYVLLGIAKHNPATHSVIIHQAGDTLLQLLKLQQPNNHDFAYHILKEISKKSYGERDYLSWKNWLRTQRSLSAIS
ncbi:HEAT repeat domain-containing protein [Legionella sp. W05-934-2]|uniref:HEAT repeat domain-containing protein n=1 Tax=Legionella sp. W05-934-2 TaxID=1198649 RepID=UPI0034626455